jgi:uncharacterized membrane protein YhfC
MLYSPLMLIAVGIESVVGVLFALYWKRRHTLSWGFFGWGAVAFVAAVVAASLLSDPIWDAAHEFTRQTFPRQIAGPLFRLCLDSWENVLVVGTAFLFAAITRVKNADSKEAVAFGIGSRGVRLLVVAFVSLGFTLTELEGRQEGDLSSWGMLLLQLPQDGTWLWVAVGTVERVLVSVVHISALVLAVYAGRIKRWGYLVVCVLYMTVAEALALFGLASSDALENLSRTWTVEAVLVLVALLGYWSVAALRSKWAESLQPPA